MSLVQLHLRRIFGSLLFLAPVLTLLSCGQANKSLGGGASCSDANLAMIGVGEGYLVRLCGCVGAGEGDGTVLTAGQTLNCHLARSDTQVVFHFGKPLGAHQIVPVGSPSFTSTPWVSAKSEVPLAHSIGFGQSGVTYTFQDAVTGMQGQIVVP